MLNSSERWKQLYLPRMVYSVASKCRPLPYIHVSFVPYHDLEKLCSSRPHTVHSLLCALLFPSCQAYWIRSGCTVTWQALEISDISSTIPIIPRIDYERLCLLVSLSWFRSNLLMVRSSKQRLQQIYIAWRLPASLILCMALIWGRMQDFLRYSYSRAKNNLIHRIMQNPVPEVDRVTKFTKPMHIPFTSRTIQLDHNIFNRTNHGIREIPSRRWPYPIVIMPIFSATWNFPYLLAPKTLWLSLTQGIFWMYCHASCKHTSSMLLEWGEIFKEF